jgi:hypothetical protein
MDVRPDKDERIAQYALEYGHQLRARYERDGVTGVVSEVPQELEKVLGVILVTSALVTKRPTLRSSHVLIALSSQCIPVKT